MLKNWATKMLLLLRPEMILTIRRGEELKREAYSIISKEIEDRNKRMINSPQQKVFFNVAGAGSIYMSDDGWHTTGGEDDPHVGFSFGVEWGRHGFTGGVLGREEAKKMAEFILDRCSETTNKMKEDWIISHNKMLDNFASE